MENSKASFAIGVFDSGVGGLTILQALKDLLPHESFIYLGDTARMPYGSKSSETIARYSLENASFLIEKKVKLLLVACHTACIFGLPKMRLAFDIPMIGVVESGAQKAASVTKTQHIAVLGTKATIQSGVHQKEILKYLPEAYVVSIECPLLAPMIERGSINHPEIKKAVKKYLGQIKEKNIDTILLGCTHYPLIKELIQAEAGLSIHLVDSSASYSDQVAHFLKQANLESPQNAPPQHQYFVSGDPNTFQALAKQLLGWPLTARCVKDHHKSVRNYDRDIIKENTSIHS
ncbi:MAG: glutamate racemase [Candidatus Protochlamydia sp.]|nr:glutamate racemase [Candidatus Protochlamydia sp.]